MNNEQKLLKALQDLLNSITNEYTDLHVADRKVILKAQKAIEKAKQI